MKPGHGVVYLADDSEGTGADGGPFWGHWETSPPDPPALLEDGTWGTADEAIAWGRTRARVVFVRVGSPPRYYSAGDLHPDPSLPTWPPTPSRAQKQEDAG